MLAFQTGPDERSGMDRGETKIALRFRAGASGVRAQRGWRVGDRMQGGHGPGHAGRQSIGPHGMGAARIAPCQSTVHGDRP